MLQGSYLHSIGDATIAINESASFCVLAFASAFIGICMTCDSFKVLGPTCSLTCTSSRFG